MSTSPSRVLSPSQLSLLALHGEERRGAVGDSLFRIGDQSYPFIAILEGEAAVLDGDGNEIVRHGASGFLGEMNLLSGQTVFLTAIVTEPMRYIAVDREVLRQLLFEDGSLSDLLLSTFIQRRELLQQRQGIGIEIIGPRGSSESRALIDFAKSQRLPFSWADPQTDAAAAALIEQLEPLEIPLVRLPGGRELRRPTNGELSRALGIGLELSAREEVDLLIVGGGPAGLGAAVYGASEGDRKSVV
jgi:thioredoxin reductase (NADPH)